MKRTPIVAGNWKMYKTLQEAEALAHGIRDILSKGDYVQNKADLPIDIVLCPPFTALHAVSRSLSGSSINLGAQNAGFEKEGAFTGEVSPPQLLDAGCTYVIIGHSERRHVFKETDELIAKRLKAAFAFGLKPILCVGETLKEREEGKTDQVVAGQLQSALPSVPPDNARALVVAYEPVWAIGTGKNASGGDAQRVSEFIRRELGHALGKEAAEFIRIQYGGSVKPENVKEFSSQHDIDGALVGGASLKPETFCAIVTGWLT